MFYSLSHPELMDVLTAAEQLLAQTGDAVELCPNYGTSPTHPQADAEPGSAQVEEIAQ